MIAVRSPLLLWGETSAFLALAMAVHLGVLWLVTQDGLEGRGGGSGGSATVSMRAADAGMAELVEAWDKPPDAMQAETASVAPAETAAPANVTVPNAQLERQTTAQPGTVGDTPTPVTPSAPDSAPAVAAPPSAPALAAPPVSLPSQPIIAARPQQQTPQQQTTRHTTASLVMPEAVFTPPSPQTTSAPPPEPEPAPAPEPDVAVATPPSAAPDAAPALRRRPASIAPKTRAPAVQAATPTQPATEPTEQIETAAPKAADTGSDAADQTASSAAGSGGDVVKGDTGAAESAAIDEGAHRDAAREWGSTIQARIDRKKEMPRTARRSGTVTLMLTVSRGGGLMNVTVAKPSGSTRLDRAALKAARRAAPFQVAPETLRGDSYQYRISVVFRL